MDFADERFIRIYVRDSKTWLRWGWEGQAVFVLTMRKFDQTGRLDVDDAVEDVALLTGLPADVVRVGLPRVLASGTFVQTGRAIECPNFIDGQTASRSDSARCREYRARLKARREIARDVPSQSQPDRESPDTKRVATDTKRPTATRDPASHPIPSQIESISSDSPPATPDTPAALDASGTSSKARRRASEVRKVFECWQMEHFKRGSRFDAKRGARIKARLDEGFSAEQLCKAIRGAKRDPFLMGKNPKSQRAYDGLETILRDAAQVERLIELNDGHGLRNAKGASPLDDGQALLAQQLEDL